ncbi:N-terminal C2 in EEIG1 and EHBP1 proteins-domain-containing protein [Emericellopsis atlantica]|uniref:N-terminal C2 in EEIG1 and EHBP1 proteins-domain-containing protein n=1 Tax=Emericellopsis atlantica TaxID=2614577 RepID=A0A9P7ZW03_9HYPO|nr:N-terminal C2 in EEIG1 and EHBP1 proteins-domain-containing protein [Emericellopsis atlantica]KAG9258663.1 N-terminal C2 in EEIG1 and EHBP1 proteins-domain-containing protein [Emericellopsis atlantica]
METLIGKGKRPKFELHLKIYDLNNVPLVSGSSYIKWHLAHSMHAEHRGRTAKCPIANHRVDYAFSKTIPHIRIAIDKNNQLVECPIELEIIQEFAVTEKMTLGEIKLNLSEYVEESEALLKNPSSRRGRSGSVSVSPPAVTDGDDAPEGIVRRYLMQESKINSTLRMSVLMVQVDGERNYTTPSLKPTATFGGIAGVVAHEPQVAEDIGPSPNIAKPRDAADIHDLYRKTLAASWSRLPSELPADECIEDIFTGGNGWRTHQNQQISTSNSNSNSNSDEEGDGGQGTLRPSDLRRFGRHRGLKTTTPGTNATSHRPHNPFHSHRRHGSAASDKSTVTVTAQQNGVHGGPAKVIRLPRAAVDAAEAELGMDRSDSQTPTMDSDRPRSSSKIEGVHARYMREMGESDVRDDLIAWKLPNGVAS